MVQPIRPQDASSIYQRQVLGPQTPDQAAATGRRQNVGGQGQGPRTDQVSLSEDARSFQRIMQSVASQSDVRPDRVQQLQERVASGEYSVDPDALARAMVEWGFRA